MPGGRDTQPEWSLPHRKSSASLFMRKLFLGLIALGVAILIGAVALLLWL
jgi:hypothetical protein